MLLLIARVVTGACISNADIRYKDWEVYTVFAGKKGLDMGLEDPASRWMIGCRSFMTSMLSKRFRILVPMQALRADEVAFVDLQPVYSLYFFSRMNCLGFKTRVCLLELSQKSVGEDTLGVSRSKVVCCTLGLNCVKAFRANQHRMLRIDDVRSSMKKVGYVAIMIRTRDRGRDACEFRSVIICHGRCCIRIR
jgi:hypothetical protein